MRVVADAATMGRLREGGGDVYVWPRRARCCGGASYSLEASLAPPPRATELVAEQDGLRIHATPGLRPPDHLELDLTRRGKVRAYWNGQPWIG